MRGGFAVADGPNTGPQLDLKYIQQAIRYALGLPGVASLVIGPHTVEQLRQNVRLVRSYQPLSDEEQAELTKLGQQLAQQWGPHYRSRRLITTARSQASSAWEEPLMSSLIVELLAAGTRHHRRGVGHSVAGPGSAQRRLPRPVEPLAP